MIETEQERILWLVEPQGMDNFDMEELASLAKQLVGSAPKHKSGHDT